MMNKGRNSVKKAGNRTVVVIKIHQEIYISFFKIFFQNLLILQF